MFMFMLESYTLVGSYLDLHRRRAWVQYGWYLSGMTTYEFFFDFCVALSC